MRWHKHIRAACQQCCREAGHPCPPTAADLVDPEVLADVDYPGAQPGSSAGLGLDEVGGEVGVAEVVLLHRIHAGHRDVVLVEVEQALEEGVHVAHELLASVPADVLGHLAACCRQHHARGHHLHDAAQQVSTAAGVLNPRSCCHLVQHATCAAAAPPSIEVQQLMITCTTSAAGLPKDLSSPSDALSREFRAASASAMMGSAAARSRVHSSWKFCTSVCRQDSTEVAVRASAKWHCAPTVSSG